MDSFSLTADMEKNVESMTHDMPQDILDLLELKHLVSISVSKAWLTVQREMWGTRELVRDLNMKHCLDFF